MSFMGRLHGLCAKGALGFSLISLGGCGGGTNSGPGLLDPTRTGEAFSGPGVVQCESIRPQSEPDLMAWDAGSRAKLKQLHEQGVVAVRYRAEGCNVELEVLNCVGQEQYEFSAYSANETKLARSERDLYAELPIGAARFGGKVGAGRGLRTDYKLSGIKRLRAMRTYPESKLTGDCDRATHVVNTLYIGGFAMAAGQSESLAAGASVFGVGAGGSQTQSAQRLVEEGSAEACDVAQREGKEMPLCSVPLRVGLTPIEGRVDGSCPSGAKWDGKQCVVVASADAPSKSVDPPPAAPPAPRVQTDSEWRATLVNSIKSRRTTYATRSLAWSPDGRSAVFVENDPDPQYKGRRYRMFLVSRTSAEKEIATGQAPIWTPDGSGILFQLSVDRTFAYYEISSGKTSRLEPAAGFYYPMGFSEDWKTVYISKMASGERQSRVLAAPWSPLSACKATTELLGCLKFTAVPPGTQYTYLEPIVFPHKRETRTACEFPKVWMYSKAEGMHCG